MIRGEAQDSREKFIFPITPFVTGGFRLDIAFSGDGAQYHWSGSVAHSRESSTNCARISNEIIIWSDRSLASGLKVARSPVPTT